MKNNIPKLRFPEFKGEWEQQQFGKLTNRVSEPVAVEPEKFYQQIGIRSHGKGIFHKELVDGKTLGNKRVFWVKPNALVVNIVFAWEQAVAKTTDTEIGMIGSHRFPMYLPIKNIAYLDYLLHFFLTKKGKVLLELASPGGAGRNKTLGQKEFENLKFSVPKYNEQVKIASFLIEIDKKIAQLTKKKNLLEQYKKGIMQKIFSQEIRFKDENGKEFPDWETKLLGEVLESLPTKKYQIKTTDVVEFGKHKVIDQGQDLIAGYSNESEFLFTNHPVIVFGDHTTVVKFIDFDFIVGADGTKILKCKKDIPLYVFYNLSFNNVEQQGYRRHYSLLSEISLQIPSIEEQNKIANFLSTIDEKINQTEIQLEQTLQFKKTLSQNMFC